MYQVGSGTEGSHPDVTLYRISHASDQAAYPQFFHQHNGTVPEIGKNKYKKYTPFMPLNMTEVTEPGLTDPVGFGTLWRVQSYWDPSTVSVRILTGSFLNQNISNLHWKHRLPIIIIIIYKIRTASDFCSDLEPAHSQLPDSHPVRQPHRQPEFDPSIRRHSEIWGAANEAVLNIVFKKKIPPKIFKKNNNCILPRARASTAAAVSVIPVLARLSSTRLSFLSSNSNISMYISSWKKKANCLQWVTINVADPDPLVTSTDLAPDSSIIKQNTIQRKSTVLWLL